MIALFGEQSEHLGYFFIILFSVMALNYHSFMSEKQPAKTHTNMLYLNTIHFHCAEKSSQNIQLNTEPFHFSVT